MNKIHEQQFYLKQALALFSRLPGDRVRVGEMDATTGLDTFAVEVKARKQPGSHMNASDTFISKAIQ